MMLHLSQYHRSDGWLGAHFLYAEQMTSTNDWLLSLGEAGAVEGTVGVADLQSGGRGRLNRRWRALPGSCLLLSLLFRPSVPFAYYAGRISMLCGLAMAEAVFSTTGLKIALKWPNDLIVDGEGSWRKIAGMLSEIGMVEGEPAFVVVGIGLNVNVPSASLPDLAPNATSVEAELGHPVERTAILDAFLDRAETSYERLVAGWDPLPDWRARLSWMGARVRVEAPTESVVGVAEGVDEEGALLVRLTNGVCRRFPVGDVSLRV